MLVNQQAGVLLSNYPIARGYIKVGVKCLSVAAGFAAYTVARAVKVLASGAKTEA